MGCREAPLECNYVRATTTRGKYPRKPTSHLKNCTTSSLEQPGFDISTTDMDDTWMAALGLDFSSTVRGHPPNDVLCVQEESLFSPIDSDSCWSPPTMPSPLASLFSLSCGYLPTTATWDGFLNPVSLFFASGNGGSNLAFLARFTSTDGLASSFECGNPNQTKRILLQARDTRNISKAAAQGDLVFHAPLLDFGLEIGSIDVSRDLPESSTSRAFGFIKTHGKARQAVSKSPTLHQKTHEIVAAIRQVAQKKRSNSSKQTTWSATRVVLCYRFFSPDNLERFLLAFWSMWYPNWPVFHKPTFVATQKPASLLAVMSLIGAFLTSETSDRDQASMWVSEVEDWIFNDDSFGDSESQQTGDKSQLIDIETQLDALRAAYGVVLILNWEGSQEDKNRARRIRFSQVIAAARSIGFSGARHGQLSNYLRPSESLASWRLFIAREELIRTLIYVFMLDCAFIMFNNCAPRMAIFELQMHLACPEVCFQASNVETWLDCTAVWACSLIGQRQPLLCEAIEILTTAELSKQYWQLLRQMSSLNYFAIASAFHNLIFYHQCGPTHSMKVSVITEGLEGWIRLWSTRQPVLGLLELDPSEPCQAWTRIGFMKNAPEYLRLAYIIYAQPLKLQKSDASLNLGGLPRRRLLQRFDDSNMDQVHELILRFQDLGCNVNG
ncbi:hypothetical protein BJ166DRAFT_510337 [Pestalotiopsis sp. NC0098]|nr:hypothetical protein BJ166DRAFT_510337 [Pestalotiopsis sp. NC0098]